MHQFVTVRDHSWLPEIIIFQQQYLKPNWEQANDCRLETTASPKIKTISYCKQKFSEVTTYRLSRNLIILIYTSNKEKRAVCLCAQAGATRGYLEREIGGEKDNILTVEVPTTPY